MPKYTEHIEPDPRSQVVLLCFGHPTEGFSSRSVSGLRAFQLKIDNGCWHSMETLTLGLHRQANDLDLGKFRCWKSAHSQYHLGAFAHD